MSTQAIVYSSNNTLTLPVASLATSSDFTSGYESNEVDNATTEKFVNAIVGGFVTVGTTPTINTLINIYAWASQVSLATTPIDVLDGTNSAETLTNVGVLRSALVLARSIPVLVNTSDIKYPFAPFSIRRLFGEMPKFWGLYVAHNTGVNLNSTAGNHAFVWNGIKFDFS